MSMKPTVGQIVHYIEGDLELGARDGGAGTFDDIMARGRDHPGTNGTRVHPAIITNVWGDTCVNLHVLLDAHPAQVMTSVTMLETPPGTYNPNSGWRWPEQGSTPEQAADTPAIASYRQGIRSWILDCFGGVISDDKVERNHRFLEEALELVQSCGCTASEAHFLVGYVYSSAPGDAAQEVGGVMVTLAALCQAHGLDMDAAAT